MKGLSYAVMVFLAAMMVFSVSVCASDKTTTPYPALRLASASQPSETASAKSTAHGSESGDTEHVQSGSGHGQGHPNLGPILPLWSCIPFACMLLSLSLIHI